jgi:hypothetical protein
MVHFSAFSILASKRCGLVIEPLNLGSECGTLVIQAINFNDATAQGRHISDALRLKNAKALKCTIAAGEGISISHLSLHWC